MDAPPTSLHAGRERLDNRASLIVGGLVPFLDSLVEPVVCTDRERRVIYQNPVFSSAWKVPDGHPPDHRIDDLMTVYELTDHAGATSKVTLEMTSIPDVHGRPLAFLGRVRTGDDDIVIELRNAAAVIATRLAAIDERSSHNGWCDAVDEQVQTLSKREREIFDLIIDGNRVATVASELYLSEHTVRNYLKRIYQKLDVHSLGELRECVARNGARTAG